MRHRILPGRTALRLLSLGLPWLIGCNGNVDVRAPGAAVSVNANDRGAAVSVRTPNANVNINAFGLQALPGGGFVTNCPPPPPEWGGPRPDGSHLRPGFRPGDRPPLPIYPPAAPVTAALPPQGPAGPVPMLPAPLPGPAQVAVGPGFLPGGLAPADGGPGGAAITANQTAADRAEPVPDYTDLVFKGGSPEAATR